jgi:fucose permease
MNLIRSTIGMDKATRTLTSSPDSPWRSLAPLFVYFAAAGVVTVMLGPMLSVFIARWHLRDAQAGTLFASFFAGQFVGSWFATRNLRISLVGGAALAAAGCAAMYWTGFHGAHLALFCCGVGLGASLAAGNVVAGTNAVNRPRALAILNISWGIGAIACPALVRFAGEFFFLVAGGLTVATGLSLTVLAPSAVGASRQSNTASSEGAELSWQTIFLFTCSLVLYIGSENALGGWIPSFALRESPALSAADVAFWFFTAEFFGRLLLAILASLISAAVLYRGSLAMLLACQFAILLVPHPPAAFIALFTVLIGICLGPVYPLLVASLLSHAGRHPRLGAFFACATIGGVVLPWMTGVVSTHFGGLRAGLLVPACGVLLLLTLSWSDVGRSGRASVAE